MTNLITIENAHAVVELSTIVEFSKLGEQSIKKIIKRKIDMLVKNGLSYPYDLSEDLNYSEMRFDEKSCTLLLTLLPNNEITEKFKEELVNQFFKMRDEVMFIREQAIREDAQKKIAKVKADANKVRIHDDGTTSITGLIQHYDFKEQYDYIKNALTWKGVMSIDIKITTRPTMNEDYNGLVYKNKTFVKDGSKETRDYAYVPDAVRAIITQYEKSGSPDVDKDFKIKIRKQLEEYLLNK